MKITTGIDIIEVNRIKEAIDELSNSFLNKVYSKKEIEYCTKSNINKYQHFAARFAGKEAIFKAISIILKSRENIQINEIEILNDELGRPYVNIENLKKVEALKDLVSIDISLSHIKEYATATVVAVFKE